MSFSVWLGYFSDVLLLCWCSFFWCDSTKRRNVCCRELLTIYSLNISCKLSLWMEGNWTEGKKGVLVCYVYGSVQLCSCTKWGILYPCVERVLITVSQHCLALLENRVSGTLHFGFVIPLFCFLFGKFLLSGHYYPTKGLIVVQKCYFGSTEAYVIWSLKNIWYLLHTQFIVKESSQLFHWWKGRNLFDNTKSWVVDHDP